jgi:hypothetical protein
MLNYSLQFQAEQLRQRLSGESEDGDELISSDEAENES